MTLRRLSKTEPAVRMQLLVSNPLGVSLGEIRRVSVHAVDSILDISAYADVAPDALRPQLIRGLRYNISICVSAHSRNKILRAH